TGSIEEPTAPPSARLNSTRAPSGKEFSPGDAPALPAGAQLLSAAPRCSGPGEKSRPGSPCPPRLSKSPSLSPAATRRLAGPHGSNGGSTLLPGTLPSTRAPPAVPGAGILSGPATGSRVGRATHSRPGPALR